MKVLIGTQNKGKIEGAKIAFEKYFDEVEIIGINVDSDVSSQPFDDEVLQGARNRVRNVKEYAKLNNIDADFYIASEAGIRKVSDVWINFNIACIEDKEGYEGIGVSQGFQIPNNRVEEIKEKDLGTVMDEIFNGNKLSVGKGGISYLTRNEVSRIEITTNAYVMALINFLNKDIWR